VLLPAVIYMLRVGLMTRFSLFWVLTIAIVAASAVSSQVRGAKSVSAYGVSPESVERVEILYFPEQILTRAALTPEMLERQYQYIRGKGVCRIDPASAVACDAP
jgi:hypothetical protein